MLVIRKLVASCLLLIGPCFVCVSSAANLDSSITSSLYALENLTGLSNFETEHTSVVYIDTRSSESCLQMSIKGGLCISPDQLRYPSGRLSSFRDINWLVGTYGLSADSVVVVIGEDEQSKYMVAAVLYLLGVRKVAIWESDFASIAAVKETDGGVARGILRSEYFSNPMRDELIALDNDLQQIFEPTRQVSIEQLTTTDLNGHLVSAPSRLPIVTAVTPSAALVNFMDQMLKQTNSVLRVHTDGLGSRSFGDFGYVKTSYSLAIFIAAFILLVLGATGFRRKLL